MTLAELKDRAQDFRNCGLEKDAELLEAFTELLSSVKASRAFMRGENATYRHLGHTVAVIEAMPA